MNATLLLILCTCLYGLGYLHSAGRQIKKHEKHNQNQRATRLRKENQ